MKIIKTEKEIYREERNAVIVEKFIKLKEEFPESTLNRIFNCLANDRELKSKYQSLTSQTIRAICKNAGVC